MAGYGSHPAYCNCPHCHTAYTDSMRMMNERWGGEVQTSFVTAVSPAHEGHQEFLHQDVNYHLALPDGDLLKPPVAREKHRSLS